MRTNKEIFETMKDKVEVAWYMYYRAFYKAEKSVEMEDKEKWSKRAEKRGRHAEEMTHNYNSLLDSLGINCKLDQYEIQMKQLKEVLDSYEEYSDNSKVS